MDEGVRGNRACLCALHHIEGDGFWATRSFPNETLANFVAQADPGHNHVIFLLEDNKYVVTLGPQGLGYFKSKAYLLYSEVLIKHRIRLHSTLT